MITDFNDFVTWMYVIIDAMWQHIAPLYRRPGPPPSTWSDSALLTMAIVAECRAWDKETNAVSAWQNYPHVFPHVPERSRFNRRRRNLGFAINPMRQVVLRVLDGAQARQCALDRLPVPVIGFHLVPGSTGDWDAFGATYGSIASKKQTIYGDKGHLLMTRGGVILDVTLTGAHTSDKEAAEARLFDHHNRDVIADKASISRSLAERLRERRGVRLLTVPRRNQQRQRAKAVRRVLNTVRQRVETGNGQRTDHLHIEHNHATSFHGLRAALYQVDRPHAMYLSQPTAWQS